MSKISEYTEGGVPQAADAFVAARAGKNVKFSALALPTSGQLKNGILSVTVVADNLVVAVKTLAGADPSTADPVYTNINGAVHIVTAALSVTVPAGAEGVTGTFNAGSAELGDKEIDFFAYLGYNLTDGVTIGPSRIPYAKQYSNFSTTVTNEKYCKISTIAAAAAADPYVVVGRFAATMSLAGGPGGHLWTVPTYTPVNLIQYPIYITRPLDWTPVHTRSGNPYTNVPTNNYAKYQLNGNMMSVFEKHTQNATPGGTNFQRVTSPFTNPISSAPLILASNNTTAVQFSAYYINANSYFELYKYDGTAEATASQVYILHGTVSIL